MLKVRIDRFEEDFVVCEDEERNFYDLKKSDFSIPLHENDILRIELDGDKVVFAEFLRDETEEKAREVRTLMQSLRKNRKK
ncbi:MAG: DUF3006 domain-containing protein [Eubacteriales bacterium]